MKVCTKPGCPELVDAGMCLAHRRESDKRRGSREQRGYGDRHRALRARWQRRLDAGEQVTCWRCGKPIDSDPKRWDLGHLDDRSGYAGPECIGCNRATAGRGIAPDA